MKTDSILGIIPARGGSKGIFRKNITTLGNKPLISWSIESALKATCLSNLIVSTDDIEIATISRDFGAEVPFLRPIHLASDVSSQLDVILHALEFYQNQEIYYDYVILLQPTSPFRAPTDIDEAWSKYIVSGAQTLISVQEVKAYHPSTLYHLDNAEKYLNSVLTEEKNPSGTLRQNFQSTFWRNGSIYIFSVDTLLQERNLFKNPISFFEMPWYRSVNIDSQDDLTFARILLNSELLRPNSELNS